MSVVTPHRFFSSFVAAGVLYGSTLMASGALAGSAEGIGGASAASVRAAVFYTFEAGGVARSKGIDKVTNPSLGVYCVRLKAGGKIANARKTIPIVSVDTETSKGSGATLNAVASTNSGSCNNPKRWIVVKTFGSDGDPTDDAAWYLIVP